MIVRNLHSYISSSVKPAPGKTLIKLGSIIKKRESVAKNTNKTIKITFVVKSISPSEC